MKHLVFALTVMGLAGCANISTFQTARPLPQGTVRYTVGGNYFADSGINSLLIHDNKRDKTFVTPTLEAGARLGVTENWDMGLHLNVPGQVGVDSKFAFHVGERWAEAIGMGLNFFSISDYNFIDLLIPYYLSFDFDKDLAVYTSVKYVLRSIRAEEGETHHLISSSFGVKLGDKSGGLVEISYMSAFSRPYNVVQVGGAFFFE